MKPAKPLRQVWAIRLKRTDGDPPEIRHGGESRLEALARARAALAQDKLGVYDSAWVSQRWR